MPLPNNSCCVITSIAFMILYVISPERLQKLIHEYSIYGLQTEIIECDNRPKMCFQKIIPMGWLGIKVRKNSCT